LKPCNASRDFLLPSGCPDGQGWETVAEALREGAAIALSD